MNENDLNILLERVIKGVMHEMGNTTNATLPVSGCVAGGKAIPVELSARHAHLSEADAITLFGAPLTPTRELSQPGQFLCKERVRLIGPKGVIDNVAILGPSRGSSQVEVSKTDARILGVDAPVRQSGDVAGSSGIILASQTGIVGLEQGLIVAARHIHMTPEDARELDVADNDKVSVRLEGDRPVILEDVLVRVSDKFKLAMHIDSDEGNSSGWNSSVAGTIISKNNHR